MPRRARRSLRMPLALGVLTWALTASAASDITETKQATLRTSTAHVLEVIGSSDICEKGCKYFGPQVVREVKLDLYAKEHSYYKWTHISGIKTVKFFRHLQIVPGAVTKVNVRTLVEATDGPLIRELEAKTKLEHDPAFDISTANFTITPKGDQVEVAVTAMTRISGLIGVFSGAVRKSMKESLDAMFANFTR